MCVREEKRSHHFGKRGGWSGYSSKDITEKGQRKTCDKLGRALVWMLLREKSFGSFMFMLTIYRVHLPSLFAFQCIVHSLVIINMES